MTDAAALIARAPGFIGRSVGGEFVLVPTGGAAGVGGVVGLDFLVLNATAASLWQKLAQPSTTEELARHLTSSYGISTERAQADVTQFLEALAPLAAIRKQEPE
ncbi:MAG: hypothetical protein NVS4B3_13540 [Gemmatimonadaceae bacterium]